jgi:hypothetical protein
MSNVSLNSANLVRYNGFLSVLAGGSTMTVNGRTYAAGGLLTIDRSSIDYSPLAAMGWAVIAHHSGTTAQRPSDTEQGVALPWGFMYLDTTINKVVVWSASGWVDHLTGLPA